MRSREATVAGELAPMIEVRAVRVLGRYTVELTFADGAVRVIDLEPFLWGEMFEAIERDYELFVQVAVDPDAGTIVWPTGADLSPRTMYAESKPAVLPHGPAPLGDERILGG